MKNVQFFKYELKERYYIEEDYADKKRKKAGEKKKVPKLRECDFEKLLISFENKEEYNNNLNFGKSPRIYNKELIEKIFENDKIEVVLLRFSGGVDFEKSSYYNTKTKRDNKNKRAKDIVEKRTQTLILIKHKNVNRTILFSERRESLLNYKDYLKDLSDAEYETFTYNTNNLTKLADEYKALEIIKISEDKDGRGLVDDENDNFEYFNIIRSVDKKGVDPMPFFTSILGKENPDKKNKVVLINDNGKRLTVNGNTYHDRVSFECTYDIDSGGFSYDELKSKIMEKIDEFSVL